MLFIVFVSLLVSLAVVSAIAVFAFLDVALAGPPESFTTSAQWQPPLARDDELFSWATATASTATVRRLAGPRTSGTARQLVAEIYEGSMVAIAQAPGAAVRSEPNCSNGRHGMVGLTPPEALVIAEEIRNTKSRQEIWRIRDGAMRNADRTTDMDHERFESAGVTCPLLDENDSCAVFAVRPMHCRGWCLTSGEDGDRCLLGNDSRDAHACDTHTKTVTSGAEDGLCRGIESAGLDGNVYELNSALVAALDTPAGAERWADGESVFEQCKRYE